MSSNSNNKYINNNNNVKVNQKQISFAYSCTKKLTIIIFFILVLSNLLVNLCYDQLKFYDENEPSITTNISITIMPNDDSVSIQKKFFFSHVLSRVLIDSLFFLFLRFRLWKYPRKEI
ncbi:hypothetical protein C1645_788293 [Glomus cerebriforme]|uniref:Transmembrane protein n=1 Tax=Glomus cerebriforme TaxID=658196 RepID=A0A397SC89_9GLOM|nr:hypothetical protein C1645_788293 [Glomus cerebriforme]